MKRKFAKLVKPLVRWLAKTQSLGESWTSSCIDWTLRNETRYRSGPGGTFVKAVSVLRNQQGQYAAIRHYTHGKEENSALLWEPDDEDHALLSCREIDQSKPPLHQPDATLVFTKRDFFPHCLQHKLTPSSAGQLTPCLDGRILGPNAPSVTHWKFFIEQDGSRYGYEDFDLFAFIECKKGIPLIYEPITHRGQYIPPEDRTVSDGLRKEYRLVTELSSPFEIVQDISRWLEYVESVYNNYLNDPDTHYRISKGLTRLSIMATETFEHRWYDRRRWEYMGHISMELLSGKTQHDMYDVPRQLYEKALDEAQPFLTRYYLPSFDVLVEGNSYIYRIVAGLSGDRAAHLLSFHRKPRRVRPTLQRHFHNCQACRHWARINKSTGRCRNEKTRDKILCDNGPLVNGAEGHTPRVLDTSPTFGCTEFSSREN